MEDLGIKKISFDNGKTYLDILDDSTFSEIILKLRKMKNWKIIVAEMEEDALMKAVEETKLRGQLVNAEQRVMFLGAYLKYAQKDLVVKVS